MDGIIDVAERTNDPLTIILSIILVVLATAFGTFLVTHWKLNAKEISRLHSLILIKDKQIININKEKDDVIENRNRQLADIVENSYTIISKNNISSIRCRDAIKTIIEKINLL